MKTTKIIIITFLATLVLSIGFSISAAISLVIPQAGGIISNNQNTVLPTPSHQLSEAEQIAKGYTYNIYTGAKLNITSTSTTTTTPTTTVTTTTVAPTPTANTNLSATELRFQAIEARLDKIEKAIQ